MKGMRTKTRTSHDFSRSKKPFRNFEQFLETNDIACPVQQVDWEAFSNSFKEHMTGIARHVEFKINPARKHRLGHRASGQPKEAPKGKLMQNETFTLSNLNILSARPLIMALAEAFFQPCTPATGTETSLSDLRDNSTPGWVQARPPSPFSAPKPRTRPYITYM